MTSDPEVSVIVPVYNGAETLGACIESVRSQSLANIEIFIVDNGSTDSSIDVALGAARADDRILVLEESRPGVSAARNRGLRRARGRWVAFMDCDDSWPTPGVLETMRGVADRERAEIVGLADYTLRGASVTAPGEVVVVDGRTAAEEMLELRRPTSVWAYLYSRAAIDGHRFDEGIHMFEDAVFNFEVLRSAASVAFYSGALYRYTPGRHSANAQPFNPRWMSILHAGLRPIYTYGGDPSRASISFYSHCLRALLILMAQAPAVSTADLHVVAESSREAARRGLRRGPGGDVALVQITSSRRALVAIVRIMRLSRRLSKAGKRS